MDVMLPRVGQELQREVRLVTVNEKNPSSASRFLFGHLIKCFQPARTDFARCPPFLRMSKPEDTVSEIKLLIE